MFCENKDSATVIYHFKDKVEKRYTVESNYLPIEVKKEKVKKESGVRTNFFAGFEGREEGSYSFTIEADNRVPEGVEVEIYLLHGLWDDYGSIGTYSTEYGIVERYEGEPLLIGVGRSVEGSVTNVEPVDCFARITVEWRFENECKLTISHEGKVLFEDTGECPLEFEVICDKDCPEGYLKCKSNKYPGYCCLPCVFTANKIRALGGRLS